jgi:hypothetical protein
LTWPGAHPHCERAGPQRTDQCEGRFGSPRH